MPRRTEPRSEAPPAPPAEAKSSPRRRAIGALWRNVARQTGEKYLKGYLDLGALGRIQVVVFANSKKTGEEAEKLPDYRILLSTPLVQREE